MIGVVGERKVIVYDGEHDNEQDLSLLDTVDKKSYEPSKFISAAVLFLDVLILSLNLLLILLTFPIDWLMVAKFLVQWGGMS
jgi:hypothetical protein